MRCLGVLILAAAALGCASGDIGQVMLAESSGFASLEELLANGEVQDAIADLPPGDGVDEGEYYQGQTPDDISGMWSTHCCGGRGGKWPIGNGFGGTYNFRVVGPGRVDLLYAEGKLDETDGKGSFIVGDGGQITLFLQLAVRCKEDGELVRVVAVDRFIHDDLILYDYVRSYRIISRSHLAPWTCFIDGVGAGSVSTPAKFGRKN